MTIIETYELLKDWTSEISPGLVMDFLDFLLKIVGFENGIADLIREVLVFKNI